MSSITQRILWRAVPVGVATALIGYGLCRFYLVALQTFVAVTVNENPDGRWQGPVWFGLAGFIFAAAVECVRKPKKAPAAKQVPVAVTSTGKSYPAPTGS